MAKSSSRSGRNRNRNQQTAQKVAPAPVQKHYAVSRWDSHSAESKELGDFVMRERLMAVRAKSLRKLAEGQERMKTASLFNDGQVGPSNIADSDNIGYYSYEFPVDSLEMPQSRPEELRFYRLAYDRDPLVNRAINLHTELPLSKMQLEKPKCSVEPFADYIFDFFQRLMNDTQFFNTIIQASREEATIGESFLYVIQPKNFLELEVSDVVKIALARGRGYASGISPMSEAENAPIVGQEREITEDWIQAKRKQSKLASRLQWVGNPDVLIGKLAEAGIDFDEDETPAAVQKEIRANRSRLAALVRGRNPRTAVVVKTAAPGDPETDPTADAAAPDAPMEGDPEMGDGADGAEENGGGDATPGFTGGGGGGFSGDMGGADQPDGAVHALAEAADAKHAKEISDLKRYLHLLERKKELLEELKEVTEKRQQEREIFSHVTNPEYEGFDRIQMLAPEKVELASDASMGPDPEIMYKPTEVEKQSLLEDQNLDLASREMLESRGVLRLNTDPFRGPYVIHFARKKAGYELHGRSMLQCVMRYLIYREKLRQVQTTLASRNMTPKTIITAPGVSEIQVQELRAMADEAKSDPDFTIVANYDMTWNEISSQGRLLALSDEYQHLNAQLAIGMGFSPEILVGEGLYGSNRIQIELLNTSYTQYRESLTNIIENLIFKPISILKGFYELDNYGRPRWIYPKVTFGRMALRDSGDLFEMLFNLYAKGSLPVSTILEFLGIDSETVTRELEDDLFTVRDSKFNELLTNVYGNVAQAIVDRTDIVNRLAKGMTLKEQDAEGSGFEGSGEGL